MSAAPQLQKRRRVSFHGEESALELAVNHFVTGQDDKKNRVQRSLSMDTLQKCAAAEGLSPAQLIQILDVAASGRYPDAVSGKLIRCLIPSSTVPLEAAAKAVSWMCTNKPSTAIQTLLMRWLVIIYSQEGVLEEKDKFRGLYSIIFYFLQNEAMCPHVCHLLYLMTHKDDVRPFRVQPLLQLQQKLGPRPYLLGLLSIYKLFKPDLISVVVPRTCKVFFRQPDKLWTAQVRRLQKIRRHQENESPDVADLETTTLETSATKKAPKRQRQDVIPQVGTALPVEDPKPSNNLTPLKPVPFAQIRSFSDLLENLDRLELPSQMAAVLRDQNLQHVMLCDPDPIIATRLAYWLDHVLYQEFFCGERDEGRCEELLVTLVKFSDFLQEGVPACEDFLARYLTVWNGMDHRPYILKMVARFRLHPFDKLHNLVLEPLRKLFFTSSVYIKCEIMLCLKELLQNYATVEWKRYKHAVQMQLDQTNTALSFIEQPNCMSVFSEEVEEFNALETIACLVQYVDRMASVGLTVESNHCLLQHCVLSFHAKVSLLYPRHDIPFTQLPSTAVVYKCLFASNAMALARMCHLLCCFAGTLDSLRQLDVSSLPAEQHQLCQETRSEIPHLNNYILDYCDTLWRHRAFTSQEAHTVYKLVSDDVAQLGLEQTSDKLSLAQHQAFLGFACNFLRTTQLQQDNVSPAYISINKNVRDVYLDYLEENAQVFGVGEFVKTFISRKKRTTQSHPVEASSEMPTNEA